METCQHDMPKWLCPDCELLGDAVELQAENARLKEISKAKQKRIRYWQREAVNIIHKFGDMEKRARIAEAENSQLKEANAALLEALETIRFHLLKDNTHYALMDVEEALSAHKEDTP